MGSLMVMASSTTVQQETSSRTGQVVLSFPSSCIVDRDSHRPQSARVIVVHCVRTSAASLLAIGLTAVLTRLCRRARRNARYSAPAPRAALPQRLRASFTSMGLAPLRTVGTARRSAYPVRGNGDQSGDESSPCAAAKLHGCDSDGLTLAAGCTFRACRPQPRLQASAGLHSRIVGPATLGYDYPMTALRAGHEPTYPTRSPHLSLT